MTNLSGDVHLDKERLLAGVHQVSTGQLRSGGKPHLQQVRELGAPLAHVSCDNVKDYQDDHNVDAIYTKSQEDNLGVDHEDVEGGGLPGVPEHVDQVLALRPVKVTVLLPHLITTNKR